MTIIVCHITSVMVGDSRRYSRLVLFFEIEEILGSLWFTGRILFCLLFRDFYQLLDFEIIEIARPTND